MPQAAQWTALAEGRFSNRVTPHGKPGPLVPFTIKNGTEHDFPKLLDYGLVHVLRKSSESVALTLNQYKAGTVSYLNVVQVQATQLNEERQTVQLLGRRLAASVALIRALGGAW